MATQQLHPLFVPLARMLRQDVENHFVDRLTSVLSSDIKLFEIRHCAFLLKRLKLLVR